MSLHDVPPMAASSSVQRPLAEGAQGTLGVPPRVEAAAAEPEPEDDPHAFDAGVAVTSLAELEALLERGGPLADEEPAGVDEEQLRAMLDLKPVLVDGLFDPAANDYVAEPANSISIDLSRAPVVSPDAFAASVARGCGDRLLTLARREQWTVRRMERECAAIRQTLRVRRVGRPPRPPFRCNAWPTLQPAVRVGYWGATESNGGGT